MPYKKIIVLLLSFLFYHWSCSKEYDVCLPVPYHAQEQPDYCAAACIQMWAEYNGYFYKQNNIADYIKVGPGGASSYDIERGVRAYVSDNARIWVKSVDFAGAKGDLIGACFYAYDSLKQPSIISVYGTQHAVLAV